MAIQVELLKTNPYFSGVSPAGFDSIGRLIFEKTAERGEVILLEGDSGETLFFVASGVVKMFKTSTEGKEQILNIVSLGESFNDVPIFDDGLNPTSAQAMGPVVLYGIKKSDFKAILQAHPQVGLNVIRILAGKVRQLVLLVENLSFRHVISRVAKILLEHIGDETDIRPRLTQQEMAAMAGTARETVGRSLKALEEEGTIRLERHRIVIADKEALKERVAASA
ncbi:Crp/Fnr family transcriptional regulator [Chloroflexota bacterium]